MSICRMLGALNREAQRTFNHEFARLGLTGGMHTLLLHLYRCDGVTQQELSRHLHFDKAHVARIIGKLMDQGYIVKERNPDDQRSYRIFLTPRALEVKPDILQVFRNWIDRLVKGFSPREREDLVELLTRMIGNLDDNRREMN